MAIATPSNGGGGYEYQFLTTPADWLMCNICHYPSRDPYLSGCCGNTFCKSCLERAKKATIVSNFCPICRDEEFLTMPNKQADRMVRNLHVFCTNKEKGCEWQGEVNNIVGHLINSDGCQFEEITCPNDCGRHIQRKYMSRHVDDECMRRMVDCQYCHLNGEHKFIVGEHKDQCPKFPIACPNKCEVDNIPREDIDEHKKICQLEKVTCPNDCGMTLQQRYIPTHIKMECPRLKIDCQYCNIKGEQQFIEGKHKEQCPKFPIVCPNKCEIGSVPRDSIEEHMKMCPLEIIQCEYHVVGCEERMARKDQKKHNKEKMEEHLSFTTQQLTSTQHELASSQYEAMNSREELTVRTTQIGKDLATTKQQLTSTQLDTVKTINRLIQRLQQTEEQLTFTKDDLTLQLKQTATTQELVTTKQNIKDDLEISKEESKRNIDKLKEEMRKCFADQSKLSADMKEDNRKWKDDLIQQLAVTKQEAKKTIDDLTQRLIVSQKEAKKTKDELTQKLTNTERELNTTKQQLAKTCQNLTKAEKEHTTLAANTDEALAKLETKFQTKITEIETAAQKRITELERNTKLSFSDWPYIINTAASRLTSSDQVVPVIVKMSEFTKKKSDIVLWYSDPFYTHHKGYRMQMSINPGGNITSSTRGTHLSVGLILMKGPYDCQLRWPLKGHCEVKLLNQISNSEHHLRDGIYGVKGHKRVTCGASSGFYMWHSHDFISNEHLQKITPKRQYLKDDSIFITVDYKLDWYY